MDEHETTAFAVMQDLNRAEIHGHNPQKYRAALVSALQMHGVNATKLNNHNNEVNVGGEWYVVRNHSGKWEHQRSRTQAQ